MTSILALALLFAASAAAPPPPNEAELKKLHDEWNSGWRTKDPSIVARLATSGFRYVAPNGEVIDKSAVLAIIRSPGYRIQEGRHTEYSFQALSQDAAVLTFRWQGRGEFDGKQWADDHRCSFTWVREKGMWRGAFEHCSAIR